MENQLAIQLRDNAKEQLAQIKTIEGGVDYLNKVKAIEVWAKAEKKDAELQNIVAEQKIRTQKVIGKLIKEGQEKGEIRKQEDGQGRSITDSDTSPKTLTEFGITNNESSVFQKIASLPDELFESKVQEIKERKELTTAGILHEVKQYEREQKNYTQSQLPSDKFRIVYADPPWKYGDLQDTPMLGGAFKHYPTMSIEELCDLPVDKITEKNAVLFLWTTSPILQECFDVVQAWGFEYKASFIWDKIKHGMGHYNSVRHELLLIATKGSCTPDNKKLYDSVIGIEKTDRHSEKPIEFINIIDDLYTWGKRIELFARSKKEGWEVWGNEVAKN
jgi:N6-adenosine-specific RNA methylase IME4